MIVGIIIFIISFFLGLCIKVTSKTTVRTVAKEKLTEEYYNNKKLTIVVEFPCKYSYRSVADELYCKLSPFKEYHKFKVSIQKPTFCTDSECEEGDKFVDW